MNPMRVSPKVTPVLDPGFVPAVLWNRAYEAAVAADPGARAIGLALTQPDGITSVWRGRVFSAEHAQAKQTLVYLERILKFLLWQKGGNRVLVAGAPEVAAALARIYSPTGARAFDHAFMGGKVYPGAFAVEAVGHDQLPEEKTASLPLGRHLDGCRIGFDLGGSDRKVAAVIDGKVVFSEETPWDPYFQSDPSYHLNGIQESLEMAAKHLPRVDAIGGSAAGVYVNNEVRVASLFRGVSPERFDREVRRIFFMLKERWGGIPFEVVNDGEVTGLAGSMALGENALLGVSMGTSQAGGYVTPAGQITPWLNELAFAPIDYREQAPRDEWSGDLGCGVQFFSQQGVARLAPAAGFEFPKEMPFPERLVKVQEAMASGDPRAARLYETIGTCYGYALAHYADFYTIRNVLTLGRVTTGEGGAILLRAAEQVLRVEFPERHAQIRFCAVDERDKRHGQAIAAASLPSIPSSHEIQQKRS